MAEPRNPSSVEAAGAAGDAFRKHTHEHAHGAPGYRMSRGAKWMLAGAVALAALGTAYLYRDQIGDWRYLRGGEKTEQPYQPPKNDSAPKLAEQGQPSAKSQVVEKPATPQLTERQKAWAELRRNYEQEKDQIAQEFIRARYVELKERGDQYESGLLEKGREALTIDKEKKGKLLEKMEEGVQQKFSGPQGDK